MNDLRGSVPPRWADRFLEWFCHPDYLEEIQGDLHEAFYRRRHLRGQRRASNRFVWDVFLSFSYRKIKKPAMSFNFILVRSYFSFIIRKIFRARFFSAVNVAGMSVGLAGALLIYLYVSGQLSYDRFNDRADRIYRVYCAYAQPGEDMTKFPYTPPVFASAVSEEILGVEAAARLFEYGNKVIIRQQDNVFNESNIYRADPAFFTIFTGKFLAGNASHALERPLSVVLSASAARRYFGSVDQAMDGTLEVDAYGRQTYTVTGIVRDFPAASHLHFNALLSTDMAHEEYHPDNWLAHDPFTYLLLKPGADVSEIQENIRLMTEKTLNPIYEDRFGKSYDQNKKTGGLQEYRLQPLTRVHLYSADLGESGNILYIYLFIAIGVLLVCIAAFNYINLATARSAAEAKVAGIRKVLGSSRSQLRTLSLIESMMICLLAGIVALILAQGVLLSDLSVIRDFIPADYLTWQSCGLLLLLAIIVSLPAGWIPARLIATLDPARVLKGQLAQGTRGNGLRKTLVVVQFAGSMILIMCTLLIGRQLAYIHHQDLGFNKENLVVIRNVDKLGDRMTTLKQMMAGEPFVLHASLCYDELGEPYNSAAFTPVELIDQGRQDLAVGFPVYIGDRDYLKTLGVKLVLGHNFPENLAQENQQIILNREALRAVGWQDKKADELVGQMIDVNGLRYELAGVVDDYNFRSLHEKIGPMAILSHYYQGYDQLMLRIGPGVAREAIEAGREKWEKIAPDVPFDYSFVAGDLDHLYRTEQSLTMLFRGFTGLAIFIACLGLLGLTVFTVDRKVKEIGVRKVLGASAGSIMFLLSQDIVKLILMAFVVATPLAWYLMNRWLENFAYHITIRPTSFIVAGVLTLILALLSICFLTIKAAMQNPAQSLKYE